MVDAAVVAVPTERHHAVARACLEAGLHVLVEKPIAATLEEADELVALAAKKEAACFRSATCERFNPAFQALAARMRPAAVHRHRAPFAVQGARHRRRRGARPHDPRPRPRAGARALGVERRERLRLSRAHQRHRHRQRAHRVRRRLRRQPFGEPRQPVAGAQAARLPAGPVRLGRPAGAASCATCARRDGAIAGDRGERMPAATRSRRRPRAFVEAVRGKAPVAGDGEGGPPRARARARGRRAWCASDCERFGMNDRRSPSSTRRRSTGRCKAEIDAAVAGVLGSGRYVLGPEGEALERELAAYVGAAHAVGCNSGTDALHLPLRRRRRRPGRRGRRAGVHLLRHRRGRLLHRRDARSSPTSTRRPSTSIRRRSRPRITPKTQGGDPGAPLRPVRRDGRDRRDLPRAQAGAGRGLRAGAGRRLRRPARRQLGRLRRLLVLSDQEPRPRRATPAWSPPRSASTTKRCACCATTAAGRPTCTSAWAGTAGWTSSRRRCCA